MPKDARSNKRRQQAELCWERADQTLIGEIPTTTQSAALVPEPALVR
jgi:hypothetical protein